ncbi:Cellobiose dehydrogenase like protein [Verticillium longisporum]|uniref:Cellobiose dehydrogenase like protein n=1 Tax=Verticillium longisporum TaxID=100787 RepID=A0A8I2ZAH6_VERLO|nr:Cellobiose dehydrogenase like protein [Verticillium longisporum]
MRFFSRVGAGAALLAAVSFLEGVAGQTDWTSPDTGIVYQSYTGSTGMTYGIALPTNSLTVDATEYLGYINCPTPAGEDQGWCGLSLMPSMTNSLLFMAHPYEGEVLTSFHFATSRESVENYKGQATITQITSRVTATGFSLEYRCQNCFNWEQDGFVGGHATTQGFIVTSWALSNKAPGNAVCPSALVIEQHASQGINGGSITPGFTNANYATWAQLANKVVTGNCGGGTPTSTGGAGPTTGPTTTSVPETPVTGVPVPNTAYDYIIVGSGAGGIPLADKLSEAGHKVLLIEKGPPSSGRWGGKRGPTWLANTNLTRFDVPGLCNEIWHDSAGIACRDTDQMAGCVLGGGTAINAALWWKPYAADWDYNFPAGWKASDVAAAQQRVFNRIPGTTRPSRDGVISLRAGMDVLRNGLAAAGWRDTDFNANPNAKNRTFGYTPYMYSNGERGGPMATYLVTANARSNFKLIMNTQVRRVIRSGGHVTGVEVEPYLDGGFQGVIPLTAVTGRVILSAGTFGSAKILLRSGIGPTDQLDVVSNSTRDGSTMISRNQWINLPVGYNLEDHTNTNVVLEHPSVQFYDFYTAYDGTAPYQADIQKYLTQRSGILAQSAPNIGPLFFEEIRGADNVVRQLQWTARMEASEGEVDGRALTISQYLGRGAKSRGRMTITPALNTVVSTIPYLIDTNDKEAVIKGIENLQRALANVPNLKWLHPAPGTTARQYVTDMVVSPSNRRANHWIGTNKLGNQDGRINNGDSVVDTNTRVYGTDNLFVVDASIFPGMVTANPSAYFVVAAEHAAAKILALPAGKGQPIYQQCGGREWRGSFQCAAGLKCVEQNPYYSQCLGS